MSASSSSSSSSYWISLAGAALSGVLATVAVTNYWHTKTADQRSKESLMQILRDRRSIFPKQYSPHRVPRSVLLELLESARWAPTHKLTEPWSFVVFESLEGRTSVGKLLAEHYKSSCEKSGKPFLHAKYEKKKRNALASSYIVAILCTKQQHQSNNNNKSSINPWWEEVCSVSMAVQNMLLVATSYKIGAYWSSGGVHQPKAKTNQTNNNDNNNSNDPSPSTVEALPVENPKAIQDFLNISSSGSSGADDNDNGNDKELTVCLGWLFIGDYYGDDTSGSSKKSWPTSRRRDLKETGRLHWK